MVQKQLLFVELIGHSVNVNITVSGIIPGVWQELTFLEFTYNFSFLLSMKSHASLMIRCFIFVYKITSRNNKKKSDWLLKYVGQPIYQIPMLSRKNNNANCIYYDFCSRCWQQIYKTATDPEQLAMAMYKFS